MSLVLDNFNTSAGRGIHHLARHRETALVVDANFRDDQGYVRSPDSSLADEYFWTHDRDPGSGIRDPGSGVRGPGEKSS